MKLVRHWMLYRYVFWDIIPCTNHTNITYIKSACTDALRRLRKGFAKRHDIGNSDAQKFIRLTEQVQRALFTFESTSNQALIRVYRRSNLLVSESFSTASEQFSLFNSSTELDNENELLTHSGADETVFLVYLYVLCLTKELRFTNFYSASYSLFRNLLKS